MLRLRLIFQLRHILEDRPTVSFLCVLNIYFEYSRKFRLHWLFGQS